MIDALLRVAGFLPWLVLPLAAFVLARTLAASPVPRRPDAALRIGAAVTIAGLLAIAARTVRFVPTYDFVAFWLFGHVAVAHANVYDPATLLRATLPQAVDADFVREVVAPGFIYPPATLLLFVPLGYARDLHLASACWTAAVLVALAAAIIVLARVAGPRTLVPIAALAVALPATRAIVASEQTHTFALLALVLAFAFRGDWRGGVAAGVAAIVKPYLAVVLLWLALRRRWNALLASLATVAVATIASTPFVGPAGLFAYLAENPAARQPATLFTEDDTASLYAIVLRLRHESGTLAGLAHSPAYLVLTALLLLATLAIAWAAPPGEDDLTLGLVVAFGLLVYPAATTIYALALVPAAVALARRAGRERAVFAAVAALAVVAGAAAGGTGVFAVTLLAWFGLAAASVARRRPGFAALRTASLG